jgi:diguanylate cyclase (GGDEF)-like protein
MPAASPDLSAFPDSRYAAALERGTPRAFDRQLEPEYVASRLAGNRALIRVACVLAALLSFLCLLGKMIGGYFLPDRMALFAALCLASAVLAAVACSRLFERCYLVLAQIVVPVRNVTVALFIARFAARGQVEALMLLPLMVVGPFFFLGLSGRAALFCVTATLASFAVAAAAFGFSLVPLAYSCVFLAMLTAASAVGARHIDDRARRSFLESRLIEELAEHDALTGTKNRRVFDRYFSQVWRQSRAEGRTVAVLLIDVDHFKAYNDRYGHQAGDRALTRVAQALQANTPGPGDLLARYGGEEFVAVLRDVQPPRAAEIAESMRSAVAELGIEHRGGVGGRVTVSVGVAVLVPAPDRGPRGALQLADQALYDAKVRGRNRVELLEEEDYRLLVTGSFARSAAARAGSQTPR